MIDNTSRRFLTDRLLVDDWHSFSAQEWLQQDPACAVRDILTPGVTHSLPPAWQGNYTTERARQWVADRDNEGTTLLAVNRNDQQSVGLVIVFETEQQGHLRLGYMLRESAWGKGYASELIAGFVDWCRSNGVQSLTGGVERDNIASSRVLEKCGFEQQPDSDNHDELMYTLQF